MMTIRTDENINLLEGYSEYTIAGDQDIHLTFHGDAESYVYITLKGTGKLYIHTYTEQNAKISYLFWNRTETDIEVEEMHDVQADGQVTVAYGECNSAGIKRNTTVNLLGKGAQGTVSSATLANTKKVYRIQVTNHAPNTVGNMQNYAVVLKSGVLEIDAVGKIVNGARGSVNAQTSRALSFEEGQRSMILPELLIDENDVQASHAMSIGRVDEDQLYYLMSRGLSVAECTSLISTGYLLPITKTLPNEELQEKLKDEMERKIAELCSM